MSKRSALHPVELVRSTAIGGVTTGVSQAMGLDPVSSSFAGAFAVGLDYEIRNASINGEAEPIEIPVNVMREPMRPRSKEQMVWDKAQRNPCGPIKPWMLA